MYITVTFNPSIDYIVFVNDFRAGKLNRAKAEHTVPGGKGLNVSMVLRNLGKQTKAFAFTGGILGDALTEMVKKEGIDFVSIPASSGETRINVKLKSGEETEINGKGPSIGKEELERLISLLGEELQEGDTLILSGSVPSTLPKTVYRDLAAMAREKGARSVVDAEGELLISALSANPFLIKPNRDELEAISGISPMTAEDIKEYAKKLRAMGAENVLVSLGGEGALLASSDGNVYFHPAPKGHVINSVGAGDSMVAGFLSSLADTGCFETALKYAVAAGSAAAFSGKLADRALLEESHFTY